MDDKRIFKYELAITDMESLFIPEGAIPLCVKVQPWNGDMVVLYALVDIDKPEEEVHYRIIGTGHPIEIDFDGTYLDSFVLPSAELIFHVFIIKN